jgi:F0F1-type ATP synthase assembly protein I
MPTPSEPEPPRRPPADAWARYAGLGLQFAATVGVFVALGLWADRKLGTSPWLVLAGALTGFAGATLALVRAVPPVTGARPARDRRASHDPTSRPSPRSKEEPPG